MPSETAPPTVTLPRERSVELTVLLGWILPGLGQLYAGQMRKAALFLVTILALFVVGWWLTDLTGVHPVHHPLHFVAHAFLGGPTAAALALAGDRTLQAMPPHFEVGRLYTAVAGLLNLVAICDAVGDVIAHNRRTAATRLAARREATRLAAEVRAAAAEALARPGDAVPGDLAEDAPPAEGETAEPPVPPPPEPPPSEPPPAPPDAPDGAGHPASPPWGRAP